MQGYFRTLDTVIKDILLCNCCGSVGFPSKHFGLIYFVATSHHITSSTIQTVFLLIHCIVHAIVDDTFSFFLENCHK